MNLILSQFSAYSAEFWAVAGSILVKKKELQGPAPSGFGIQHQQKQVTGREYLLCNLASWEPDGILGVTGYFTTFHWMSQMPRWVFPASSKLGVHPPALAGEMTSPNSLASVFLSKLHTTVGEKATNTSDLKFSFLLLHWGKPSLGSEIELNWGTKSCPWVSGYLRHLNIVTTP